MSMGLSFLPQALGPVVSAQAQNSNLRNQMSQQANERRGRELAETHRIMASSFETMSHSMTSKVGKVDFTV